MDIEEEHSTAGSHLDNATRVLVANAREIRDSIPDDENETDVGENLTTMKNTTPMVKLLQKNCKTCSEYS